MRKARRIKSSEIQKEQSFLVQLERELTSVLGKINENLNNLKVEELQLRSNAVNSLKGSTVQESSKFAERIAQEEEPPTFNDNPELVNQQEIDLDIYCSNFNEEEDDD